MKRFLSLLFLLTLLAISPSLHAQGQPQFTGVGGVIPFSGVPSGSCSATQLAVNTSNGNLYSCSGSSWALVNGSAASVAFSAVTAGSNATALVISTGGSLTVSGSGTINATTLLGNTWAAPGAIGGTTPGTAAFTTLSASGTVTFTGIEPGSTQCLQISASGVVSAAGFACGSATGGVTSVSGDGTFYTNSASTGAVTLALGAAPADSVWGNPTGSSATPVYTANPIVTTINALTLTANSTGFQIAGGTTSKTLKINNSLTLAGTDSTTMTFPGTSQTIPGLGQSNTYTTGTQSFSGVTALLVPASAGFAPTASESFGYDTTANRFVGGENGTAVVIPYFTSSTPVSTDCVTWSGTNGQLGAQSCSANPPFSSITTGTNTSATMTCGTGCEITVTGTGVVDATAVPWSGITAPSANLTLSMSSNTSTFNTTTAVSNFFEWANTTASTSSASQSSPILSLCGTAWTGSSATDCLTFQDQPSNGANAAITFAFGHTGTSTGIVTSAFPGPVEAGASSASGALSLPGNSSAPSLGSNLAYIIGPDAASFTAYGLQLSTTGPAAAGTFLLGAPSSGISQVTYGLLPLSDIATQAAGTVVMNATTGTASPTAVAMPSCSGSSQALQFSTSINTFGCTTISGSGAASSVQNAFTAGTVTSGNLACYTSSNTIGNCTTFPPNNFAGIFYNGTGGVQTQGVATVNLDATVSVTDGDVLCASGLSDTAHDNGSIPCTNGEWVGFVETTASSVTSATAILRLQ